MQAYERRTKKRNDVSNKEEDSEKKHVEEKNSYEEYNGDTNVEQNNERGEGDYKVFRNYVDIHNPSIHITTKKQ